MITAHRHRSKYKSSTYLPGANVWMAILMRASICKGEVIKFYGTIYDSLMTVYMAVQVVMLVAVTVAIVVGITMDTSSCCTSTNHVANISPQQKSWNH